MFNELRGGAPKFDAVFSSVPSPENIEGKRGLPKKIEVGPRAAGTIEGSVTEKDVKARLKNKFPEVPLDAV